MRNFSIVTQIKKELDDFYKQKVVLSKMGHDDTVRYAKGKDGGYYFNQHETIAKIDLTTASQFEDGPTDTLGMRKMYMNVTTFRTEVAAKQTDLDLKDFKFTPEDGTNPWPTFFVQRDFRMWAKDHKMSELVNEFNEAFPKYGTIVGKKVGKAIEFMPLQLLRNEQTAKSLQTARYVIEEHPDMYKWELEAMKGWNLDGLQLKSDECCQVFERYGYVPLGWLKSQNGEDYEATDFELWVDAQVICTYDPKAVKIEEAKQHIFSAKQITERPYREAHWKRQHGRWLGVGEAEDLFANQTAANMVINLYRRSMHWSSKRVFQTKDDSLIGKNLVADVADGDVLGVGMTGEVSQIDTTNHSQAEYNNFLTMLEKNADQKAFTYEVATGENLPSGTPFRLGIIMSNAVQSYFELKREKLGLFLREIVQDFLVPQFLRDMGDKERLASLFSDEEGFELVKEGAMEYVKGETIRATLLGGEAVDISTIETAIQPFEAIKALTFEYPESYLQEAEYKITLDLTGESMDLKSRIESLTTLGQIWQQIGDPRAEKAFAEASMLSGVNLAKFGPKPPPPMPQPEQVATNVKQPQPA